MAAPPIPPHIPTADELGALIIEKIAQDGTCVVFNQDTGERTMCRLGILPVSNTLTLVAIGPGSG
jgi:hypothetical protein